MDCHHARLLLAFWRRPADGLDADDTATLRQHLDACPECAALARDERRADGALGPPLRDVPIPAGLEQRLLHKLAAQRRPFPWLPTAAAIVVAAIGLGSYLALYAPPHLSSTKLAEDFGERAALKTADDVERWFNDHGTIMQAPRQFDYRYLRSCDRVELKGRLVPLLVFHDDRAALAEVYVLSATQFQLNEFRADIRTGNLTFLPEPPENPEVVYLVNGADYGRLLVVPQ